jgi:hypothetical protein
MYSIKSLLQLLIKSLWAMGDSITLGFLLSSYLASYFLVPMAASNIGPLVQN